MEWPIKIMDGVAYKVSKNGKNLVRLEIEYVQEHKEEILRLYTCDELMEEIIRRNERD